MKTVLLSYYYPPLKAPRATQVSRLVEHSQLPIQVLCAAEGATPCRPDVTVSVYPDATPRWRRLVRHLTCMPDALRPWADRVARQVEAEGGLTADDVLVTCGQPMSDHLAGLNLKRRIGMRWIAHFSDPWADNPFHLPIPFAKQRLRAMEADVFAAADRLLFTSPETVELVMRKYPAQIAAKAAVLPHAFEADAYGAAAPAVQGATRDGIVIRYLGNFYRQRNPRRLADALGHLYRTRPEVLDGVRIELIGTWNRNGGWSAADHGLPADLLSLKPSVGYRESLALMRAADLLLIVDAPFENSVFFPSKLVDYLGAGRPVLAMTPPGASARIVQAAGGCLVDPYGTETAAEDIACALHKYRTGELVPPPRASLAQYDARYVSEQFDKLILSIAVKCHQG